MDYLTHNEIKYVQQHLEENIQLLKTLTEIPSPTFHEKKRATFCLNWLQSIGANAYMDNVNNVICPINGENNETLIIIMAHNDIAFPDIQNIQVKQVDNKLFAPGIGDDTANMVNMLMTIQYIIKMRLQPKYQILFVINSGEEGLGNSMGCRQIIEEYHSKIKEFISLDGYLNECTYCAVGSKRYQIDVKTHGGHSYVNFGQENAIAWIAKIITQLNQISLPTEAKTTFNFGKIEGGSAINVIANHASVTYEFRSSSQQCLNIMEQSFQKIINNINDKHIDIQIKVLGERPGNGPLSQEKMRKFTSRNLNIIQHFYKKNIILCENSTDSNIPLSYGICANTIGTIIGGDAHTYHEWIDINSIPIGFQVAMALILQYVDWELRI